MLAIAPLLFLAAATRLGKRKCPRLRKIIAMILHITTPLALHVGCGHGLDKFRAAPYAHHVATAAPSRWVKRNVWFVEDRAQ